MKKLLQISLDTVLASLLPIFSWLLLSIIIDRNLINVFTLTYPVQFIYGIFKSIFATGANISKEEDNNKNAVLSGMTLGMFLGSIVFGLLIYNVDYYIRFMNMDISIYKEFTIYSLVQIYLQLILSFVLMKNYYENNYNQANRYSIIFNCLNFIILIGSSLVFKDKIFIVFVTLLALSIYTIIITLKSYKKYKFRLNIFNLIKYDSVELFNQLLFFIIFLFGLSNVMDYGIKYILALTFVSLITDSQWDVFDSISTIAKIDISKNVSLYWFYDLNLVVTLIFLSFEIINFIIYPIYKIKTCFLQLEYSPLRITTNKIFASSSRVAFSFLNSPYCTGMGQIFSSVYQFITINFIFSKHYVITLDGTVIKK
jgi:hypothetical protein